MKRVHISGLLPHGHLDIPKGIIAALQEQIRRHAVIVDQIEVITKLPFRKAHWILSQFSCNIEAYAYCTLRVSQRSWQKLNTRLSNVTLLGCRIKISLAKPKFDNCRQQWRKKSAEYSRWKPVKHEQGLVPGKHDQLVTYCHVLVPNFADRKGWRKGPFGRPVAVLRTHKATHMSATLPTGTKLWGCAPFQVTNMCTSTYEGENTVTWRDGQGKIQQQVLRQTHGYAV